MNKEIWKEIKGYNGKYFISNYGNVKSVIKNEKKYLKKYKTEKGYLCVYLYQNNKLKKIKIHKLVADNFLLNKNNYKSMPYEKKEKIIIDNLQINHKDENKENNNVGNLEWCTCSYNINYGKRNNKHSKKMSKRVKQYDLNGNFIKEWDSLIQIQRILGIPITKINKCNHKKPINNFYWVY